MLLLLRYLIELFIREWRKEGFVSALRRLAGAARALQYRAQHRELFDLDIYRNHIGRIGDGDALFHLSHRHYLSSRLSYRERVECALHHYRYETAYYDRTYKNAVYGDGGLTVWSKAVNGSVYSIKLRSTTDPRQEGGTGIFFYADQACLTEMSFVWIDGALLGAPPGRIPFITKNQSVRYDNATLRRFREAFPQNSPSYFCFAAMHGIAAAHGNTKVAGIKHDCQIAFAERYAAGFSHAYSELWKAFGGVEIDGHAYLMPVPMAARPVADIRSKHRKRALQRRFYWTEIADCAAAVTLRSHKPPLGLNTVSTTLLSVAAYLPSMLSLPTPI